MTFVTVIPGTKLPLNRSQGFAYELKTGVARGQVVAIPLGRRRVWGVVSEQLKDRPTGFAVKNAEIALPSLPAHNLLAAQDIARAYRVPLSLIIKLMLPPGRPATKRRVRAKKNLSNPDPHPALTLSESQAKGVAAIERGLGQSSAFLLHGVTGSGKTECYAAVAQQVLQKGGQVLFLVPEIAMTPQLSLRLEKLVGPVVTWHSGKTPAQKSLDWQTLCAGKPAIVLGPRSALFLPLPKLGLIVVDEEHDASYKQWDQEPRFHGRAVARMLSLRAKCPVVYGSATPSLETWHLASQKKITLLELTDRFGGTKLPTIDFIDVRGLPPTPLSPPSLEAISKTLASRQQVLVLLNRRGTNRVLLCRDCGNIWRCSKCERAFVVHHKPSAHLSCHFCEITLPLPAMCPKCHGASLLGRGFGTEFLEGELKKNFPSARIARLDRDVSRKKTQLEAVAQAAMGGQVDILVGTQLIAKGWDLAKLQLVVVLDADQGLLAPDFRAHERTMQLLWQVAGRAGRRHTQGRVLLETMHPDHPTLRALQTHDFATFAEHELMERARFGFPPYRRVLKIIIAGRTQKEREKAVGHVLNKLRKFQESHPDLAKTTEILPAWDFVAPGGKKTTQVVLLTQRPSDFFTLVPSDLTLDIDPEQV